MTKNLECVVEKRDQICKTQKADYFLSCLQLPRYVEIGSLNVHAQFLDNCFGFLGMRNYWNDLVHKLIFSVNYVAFPFIPCNKNVFIVDTHPCDPQVRHFSFGKATVLEFSGFVYVVDYIVAVYYRSWQNALVTQYEIQ